MRVGRVLAGALIPLTVLFGAALDERTPTELAAGPQVTPPISETFVHPKAAAKPRVRSPRRVRPKPRPKPVAHLLPKHAASPPPIPGYGTSAWVNRVRLCIMHFESHGNYRAQNPTDTASGAYQFVNTTWMAITGLPGPAKAYSPAIQDHAFYVLFANGRGAHNWATWPLCASL